MDRKDKDKEDLTDYLLAKRKEQPKKPIEQKQPSQSTQLSR